MIAAGCILGILGLQDKYIGTEGLEMSYRVSQSKLAQQAEKCG